jgi:hypothetical protein
LQIHDFASQSWGFRECLAISGLVAGVRFLPRAFYVGMIVCAIVGASSGSSAQTADQSQLSPTARSSVTAVSGQPLGVVSLQLPLPEDWSGGVPRILLEEESGRVFYATTSPIVSQVLVPLEPLLPQRIGRPGGLIDRLRETIGPLRTEKREVPVGVKVHALFVGDQPLHLSVLGDIQQRLTVPVVTTANEQTHRQLLDVWWRATQESAAQWLLNNPAQASVPHYLVSMLSSTLELPAAQLPSPPPLESGWLWLEDSKPKFIETLETLTTTDRQKEQAVRRILQGPLVTDSEPLPLPPGPDWQAAEPPPQDPREADQDIALEDIALEDIASRVPPECFYLRFGSFGNYLWFQELGQRFGGELSSAVMMSSVNYGGMARTEQMLATRTTTVSRMFGDKLIRDMALLGNDLYFNDGPSMGVLFQASNAALLQASFQSDRRAILAENPDAAISEITIGDKPVSLISTPDNRIRAFLLVDGPFVLISTSRHLVDRFIEVGQGKPSLASSKMFQWVRGRMPLANDYSVFGYFSPDFFQNLLGPHYQIELKRRLQAAAHLEIADLASRTARVHSRWAESAESAVDASPANDLQTLRSSGLLPPWFDQRPDEARVLLSGDRWVDSTRGGRGSFLPIPDVAIYGVSAEEAADYARTAEYYQQNWGRMDPLFFGLRRFQYDEPSTQQPAEPSAILGDSGSNAQQDSASANSKIAAVDRASSRNGGTLEQFTIEAFLSPFEPKKYGWVFEQLAEPSPVAIRFPPDDMLSVQMRFSAPVPGESYYLFGGLKDMLPPPAEEKQGLLKSLRVLRSAPAYLGAWPKPDLVEMLPLGIGSRLAQPDFAGYSRVLGGLWRWQDEQWSLLSFDKSILDSASRQIAVAQASNSAQIRVALADLHQSQLAEWIDQLWWEQGWKSSLSNASLLDALQQQFQVPAQESPQVAATIFDAQLQCPLGGQYLLRQTASPATSANPATGIWYSTAWESGSVNSQGKPIAPTDYSAPWIQWLRGAQIQVTQQPQSLSVVGLMQVDLPPVPGTRRTDQSPSGQPSSDAKPMGEFNVFELPLKLFGKRNAKDKDQEADKKPAKPPATRKSF